MQLFLQLLKKFSETSHIVNVKEFHYKFKTLIINPICFHWRSKYYTKGNHRLYIRNIQDQTKNEILNTTLSSIEYDARH